MLCVNEYFFFNKFFLILGHDDVDRIYPTQLYTDTVVKTRTRRCHVKACRSTDPPDKLYFFPKDEEQRESWIVVCSVHRKYLQHKKLYICQKHFRCEMIGKQRLKKNAFPTLHLGDDEETEDDESDVWDSEDDEIDQKDVNWRNFEYIVKIEEVGD